MKTTKAWAVVNHRGPLWTFDQDGLVACCYKRKGTAQKVSGDNQGSRVVPVWIREATAKKTR